ncbi:MAG: hypothetical protein FRX48_04436 [Lasallia pustulata]|uniref:Uncharacterized protein n=1 Tax=Lasallia pustulata TaxID=136370 RepID=A0A5M8PUH4_9LECA|nr:MAG: hypothetical protein FRX48_04436 [Lasallia pustulata]
MVSSKPRETKRDESLDKDDDLQALFRQHFESRFKPLKGLPSSRLKCPEADEETPENQSESDWEGLSDEEYGKPVEVVEHKISTGVKRAEVPREELKTFMTTKPPSSLENPLSTAKRKQPEQADGEEAATEAANLKKDLALQRLLKESHLLDSKSSSSLSGSNRHKALDLRLQDLGSKSSILMQEKMPLSHRKGIVAKAREREENRRREAKENGIILEKAVKGTAKKTPIRQRGIGGPSVGKFQGGMLKLSKKDVADIVGPRKKLKVKKGGRR